jgi:hypothetical protein
VVAGPVSDDDKPRLKAIIEAVTDLREQMEHIHEAIAWARERLDQIDVMLRVRDIEEEGD